MATIILGSTGSGKTTALMDRYCRWVRSGVRTDQILVLTTGARHSSRWRRGLQLEACGPVEAYSFFGFIKKELNLFWVPVQAAYPGLGARLRPEFLDPEISYRLMQGLLDPMAEAFSEVLKASPRRLSIQLASNLSTVAAGAGLGPAEATERLAGADREEKQGLYRMAREILETYQQRCLQAGVLDYSLALRLYTEVLMRHPPYLEHLRDRYRYLVVDDLDESTPAEQDFLEAVSGQMEEAVYAFSTDGGHMAFRGADPTSALERFRPGAREELQEGSHTCSPAMFAFGDALYRRILGQQVETRFRDVVADWITTDLRGEMICQVVDRVADLVEQGVPPGEIAVLCPWVERSLEVTARRELEARHVAVRNLSPGRRVVDDPYAAAIIALAGLVCPQWGIPRESGGLFAGGMQVLLGLDPVRAALLGDAIWRTGDLPDLDETGLRRRVGFERAEAYEYLRRWVQDAREKEWETDELVQAIIAEVLVPLRRDLPAEAIRSCQQLLDAAYRFRQVRERLGEDAFGPEYIRLLTEGTVAAASEDGDPDRDAIILATPYAYIDRRISSRYRIWVDISGDGWYAGDVKELFNPHVLSRRWPEGERWTAERDSLARQASAARTARALVRRCRERLILAECGLSAWGQEQEGRLAEVFSDLIGGGGAP